jgi:hypothetical protein
LIGSLFIPNLKNTATRDREVSALREALTGVKVKCALILMDANASSFEIGGIPIEIQSVEEWLPGHEEDSDLQHVEKAAADGRMDPILCHDGDALILLISHMSADKIHKPAAMVI